MESDVSISINLNVILSFHGSVPEVVLPSYAVGSIYIPGNLSFVSFITM